VAEATLFIFKLADSSTRHRMAIRRELLRLGAVNLQPGVWLVPTPNNQDQDERLGRARSLVQRAEGRVLLAAPAAGPIELAF
jgi:DNA-binding transcriptional regulator PaaX